jgi:hypothetical protein
VALCHEESPVFSQAELGQFLENSSPPFSVFLEIQFFC